LAKRWVHKRSNRVVGFLSHESEDVSTYITSSESRQIPVGFDGGYLRIVDIEVAVGGSNEMLGDSVAEKNVNHPVLYIVNSGLIESEKNERPVTVEVWVFEERCKESVYKGTRKSDIGVMTVVCHVRGDEHPLRKSVVLQIFSKQGKVLDISSALWNIGYRVINNQRIVLANISIRSIRGEELETRKAR